MNIYKDIASKHGARVEVSRDEDFTRIVFTPQQLTEYSRSIIERAIKFKPYTHGAFDMSHEDAEAVQ